MRGSWYRFRNSRRWCRLFGRHVCQYVPGCTAFARQELAQIRAYLKAREVSADYRDRVRRIEAQPLGHVHHPKLCGAGHCPQPKKPHVHSYACRGGGCA